MIAICLYRAANQAIIHDEALTYLLFIAGPWRRAIAYTGNQNHILLVVLDRLILMVLPVSEFTLRLPVVASAVLYAAAAASLLRRLVSTAWLRVAGFALLTLNAYVLEYFSEARGYGLMLACLLAAACRLMPGPGDRLERRAAIEGGALLGLAMAAVPVAAFPVAGFLAACVLFDALESGGLHALVRGALVAGAGAVIATPLLLPQIYHARRGDYYLGARTIPMWIGSLVKAGWSHRSPHMESMVELTPVEWIVFAGSITILAILIVTAAYLILRWPSTTGPERGLIWVGTVIVTMAAAAVLVHAVAGIRYPEGRVALYWLPLMILVTTALVGLTAPGTWKRCAGGLLIAVMSVNTAVHATAIRHADHRFDGANREAIDAIIADRRPSTRPITIGGSWIFEPGMNFYRVTRNLDWLSRVERRPPVAGADYYVLLPEDAGIVDALGLRVLSWDPAVGTIVAVPRDRR